MAWLGLIPAILGALSAARAKSKQAKTTTDLSTPNYATTSVLLAGDEARRGAQNRKGRRSTDLTQGTLSGTPTLGGLGNGLFGLFGM